jgi:predicted ATPase
VLIERRKFLHDRIGGAIESIHEKSIDDHVVELAHHYQRSDNASKAVHYLRRAGERALSRSQFNEAASNAADALQRLREIPGATERMRAELPIRLIQAQAATGTLGYTATEVEKALSRARELGRQVVDRRSTFSTMGFLRTFHMIGAEHEKAKALAEELLALAKSENNAAWLGEVQYATGANLFWMGRFGEAMRALEESIRYCQDNEHPINVAGADTLGLAHAYQASCLWYLGYPDKALQSRVETLARAEVTHQPYTMAAVLLNVCQMGLLRRDPATMNDIETLIALSEEHGFQLLQMWGSSFQAAALLQRHPSNEALSSLADYVARASEMKANLAGPIFWSFLAQAHVRMGKAATGLDVIATALQEVERTSGRYVDAELHRLRGELLMISDPTNLEQAEGEFRHAVDIARRQEAKSLELRATTSLARLLEPQGRRDEARAMLNEIYGWFTEGFDTADLKDAKALLVELVG